MNKHYSKVILFLALIVIAGVALYIREKVIVRNPVLEEEAQIQEPTGFTISSIKKETFKDTSSPGFEIHGEYPVDIFGADYIKGRIYAELAQFKAENDPAKLTPTQLEEFGPTKDRQYSFITQYKAYGNASFLTHRLDTYTYSGGAHGGTVVKTYTYDFTGKSIVATDLFVDEAAIKRFSELVQQHALALPDYKEAINTEWLAESAGPDAGNFTTFAFNGSNLVIIFQQYAIASYAAGIIEVSIPFSELEGIVKPEFLK